MLFRGDQTTKIYLVLSISLSSAVSTVSHGIREVGQIVFELGMNAVVCSDFKKICFVRDGLKLFLQDSTVLSVEKRLAPVRSTTNISKQ